jgi:phospholipid/cholesterol/gamma-HCH transport system substrate-binding protein
MEPLLLRALACAASLASLSGCELTRQLAGGGASVVVDDAQGISVGNQVRVHGVQVGRVTAVTLEPAGARLALELGDVALRSDACAMVRTQGLVGEVYVHVQRGEADTPWEGGELRACPSATLEGAAGESLSELAGLLGDLRRYVGALERGEQALCTVRVAEPGADTSAASASETGSDSGAASASETGSGLGAEVPPVP